MLCRTPGVVLEDKRLSEQVGARASADLVAEAIVDAVANGTPIVLVGPFARLMYNAKRLSRRLAEKLMLAEAKKPGYS
jgi:hypothetical protein